MLKKYLDFLNKIFESITHKGGNITFADYISGIGMSIAIIAIIMIFIIILIGGWKFPSYVYHKSISGIMKKKEEFADQITEATKKHKLDVVNALQEKSDALDTKLAQRRLIFIVGVIALYVPVIIPTILYLLYLIFHV